MPPDRAEALKQAEKLVRQGKLEQAIAEYFLLVEEQPSDWNTANMLGDLLVRAGRLDDAVAQFARSGDTLRDAGFLPRAAALYKKILKLRPQDDRALMQAGELAARQGLLADARAFLRAAADARRTGSDERGVLEVVIRLGALDKADVAARLAGARARLELGDGPGAIREFADLAAWLADAGREAEALAPLREIAHVEPGHPRATAELARILVAQGRQAEAAEYLEPVDRATAPIQTIALAEACFRAGDESAAFAMIDGLLDARSEDGYQDIARLAASLNTDMPECAVRLLERALDHCAATQDWAAAVGALRAFLAREPGHAPALVRMVGICDDAGDVAGVVEAQTRLVDAYLAAGAASEARVVAEDLVRRQPAERAHLDRLRAVLRAAGDADPQAAAAEWLAEVTAEPEPALSVPKVERPHDTVVSPSERPRPPLGPHAIDLEALLGGFEPAERPAPPTNIEVDLSVELDEIRPHLPVEPWRAAPLASGVQPANLDEVFQHLRDEAQRRPAAEAAELAFQRGKTLYEAGEVEESIEPLRSAARLPSLRHAAASLLARIFRDRAQIDEAIEWLGHAADAPVQTDVDRHATLLGLADVLEAAGESARALGVCLELQAEAGDYGDVNARIARLSASQEGG